MMKNILVLILLCTCSFLLIGQEKEHLYFMETDSTWRKEMFLFPIHFAKDINYKGCVINKCRTDAVILDLVESKKISIAALRVHFFEEESIQKNKFKPAFIIFMSLRE